jgi:ribosomal protein S18 acetylase RimI-like enzyme
MSVVIRNATEKDIPLLSSIIRGSFIDVAKRFSLTPQNCPKHPSNCEESWIVDELSKGVNYFILEVDGVPSGSVGTLRNKANNSYLMRLGVLPEYRNRGLGKKLVDFALDKMREDGTKTVEIGVISDQTELVEWYEGFGFHISGKRDFAHLPFEVTFMTKEL